MCLHLSLTFNKYIPLLDTMPQPYVSVGLYRSIIDDKIALLRLKNELPRNIY